MIPTSRRGLVVVAALALITTPTANATTFSTPAATYTAGGTSAQGLYYAKSGSTLTLTVKTDERARCVQVTGLPTQTSTAPRTTWTFTHPTASGADGVRTATVTIGENSNPNGVCTTRTATTGVSYVLDNTGPTATASLAPAPNAAGWNKDSVAVTWTADDAGGVGGGTVTPPSTVTADTAGTTVTGTATDALGNTGPTASVVVRRDTGAPAISSATTPAANGHGWRNAPVTVTFTCADPLSHIASCRADGSTSAARTLTGEGADQSVSGTATDNAGNTQSTVAGDIDIDFTSPTVSAATPYTGGTWTNQPITVTFTCADALSGVDTCTAPVTLSGEGADQSATGTATDKAGNTGTTTFGDVDIDRTAPVTTATAPAAWTNTDVAVQLTALDALSGVRETRYSVDGGPEQTGTSVPFTTEGSHTLTYLSTDHAGNAETPRTVTVDIDKTPPGITHHLFPAPNAHGWLSGPVLVTFHCTDSGSGVTSCGPDRTISDEGANQAADGTATDRAGNTATDPVRVNIDLTAPTITAAPATSPNSHGWYREDVTVAYTCADALSGVDTCPAPTVLTEGTDTASGTATDAAGNTATATLTGINVDKTGPTLTGAPSTTDWTTDDVTVTWTCTDAGSGVQDTPAPSTVTGEGAALAATASCTDNAGNTTTVTVAGLRIDRAAPATQAEAIPAGWHADRVDITLTATDALSGIAQTQYRVDDGPAQPYTGTFAFTTGGKHTIAYWSTDAAGNTEDPHALAVWIDDADPTVTADHVPANAHGWHNTPLTVSFTCDDTQSGIASCADPVELGEGADQSATGYATDGVGKTATTTVTGLNVDLTPPTLTPSPTAGWHRADVTVQWTATDALSGVDTAPADSVITGEGRSLGAGPVTATDKAGNGSAPASVTDVLIDRTAPVVAGTTLTAPNANGWFRDEVVVDFTCTDPKLADGTDGSGVATCPTSRVLRGDGVDQSVTADPATDVAGNTGAPVTFGGVDIDGTPPTTTADHPCSGWCTGSTATVVLTASDALSGVTEIHYRRDSGPEQTAPGASATITVPLDGSGSGTLTYWAVDRAGNVESVNTAALKWDNIAPAVTHTLSPAPNADDWNNSDVTVTFSAQDDDAGSGVDPATLTPPAVVSTETAGTTLVGTARDLAGNTGTDTVTVRLDKTAPTITAEVVGGPKPWHTAPVTVHFTCTDNGSGIPATACPDDVVLAADGSAQSATASVTDRAGNTSHATATGINIDQTAPTFTTLSPTDGAIYEFTAPTPTCTASDAVSGPDTCTVTTTPLGEGTHTFTATARDQAGNTATRTGRYQLRLYRFSGYLQPINDPATPVSVFKTGSTVPVKFHLRDAAGTPIQALSAPTWLTPVRGGATTSQVNESAFTDQTTTDGTFRWDPTARQYVYNWQTKGLAAGYHYKIGVKLDDGQLKYVTVGLK
ncbi:MULTISPECIES: OmpL47-type beta-barrel domain-containing protein [unclassified Saccharothrix]|uniref:OmpL47-type beta-barrel domain-containing protein n=1 Tax=unclassified Saccharothrix TaxID=2593673 RepID=UPI00307F5724